MVDPCNYRLLLAGKTSVSASAPFKHGVPHHNPPKPTIVVVDDDSDTVEFLCDYLRGMGFHAVRCRPGPHTPACIAEHAPSLVILDLEMGDTTGIDVFHAMRADSATHRVPVIFFTGNADKFRHQLPP